MFVQWKQKKLKRGNDGIEGISMRAILVESHRVNGRPIKKERYLGSIRSADISDPKSAVRFWARVNRRLDQLLQDREIAAKLRSDLAAVVPDPWPAHIRNGAAALLRRNQTP